MECIAVKRSEDAREALQDRGEGYFDVILLDVALPGESGWDFLDSLRDSGNTTPVIFLTGSRALEERVRGLRLGADDYVVKPFETDELMARIEVVLRRQPASELEVGDLMIDLKRRLVQSGDRRIELSPRGFDLLRELAEARGRALSKDELLRRVWDIEFDPGTNVVEVQVARLRKKLQDHGASRIETVMGKGYRLMHEPQPSED